MRCQTWPTTSLIFRHLRHEQRRRKPVQRNREIQGLIYAMGQRTRVSACYFQGATSCWNGPQLPSGS